MYFLLYLLASPHSLINYKNQSLSKEVIYDEDNNFLLMEVLYLNNKFRNLNQTFSSMPMSRLSDLVYVADYEQFNGGAGHEAIY